MSGVVFNFCANGCGHYDNINDKWVVRTRSPDEVAWTISTSDSPLFKHGVGVSGAYFEFDSSADAETAHEKLSSVLKEFNIHIYMHLYNDQNIVYWSMVDNDKEIATDFLFGGIMDVHYTICNKASYYLLFVAVMDTHHSQCGQNVMDWNISFPAITKRFTGFDLNNYGPVWKIDENKNLPKCTDDAFKDRNRAIILDISGFSKLSIKTLCHDYLHLNSKELNILTGYIGITKLPQLFNECRIEFERIEYEHELIPSK